MALALSTLVSGDTQYIAKHNANYSAIQAAVNSLINTVGGASASAANLTSAYAALFGLAPALVGASSLTASIASLSLNFTAGFAYLPAAHRIAWAATGQTLDLSLLADGTWYISLDSLSAPTASASSTDALYSVVKGGGALSSLTCLASVVWGAADWVAAQASTGMGGGPYTTLDGRFEAIETSYIRTSQKGAASGVASLDSGTHVPVAELPDLSATYQVVSAKGAANGYASLGSDGKVPSGQLPSAGSGGEELQVNKGAVSGYCGLDASQHVAAANLTAANMPDLSGTYKVLAYAEPVLIAGFVPGTYTASQVLLAFLPAVAVTIDANLANTRCKAGTNPTGTATLSVQKNAIEVATIQIATNGAITLSTQAAISLAVTDELTVLAPSSADGTLAGVRLTIHGTR